MSVASLPLSIFGQRKRAVVFRGPALGGILGMMLAVPLTAFVVTDWRLVRRKYFGVA